VAWWDDALNFGQGAVKQVQQQAQNVGQQLQADMQKHIVAPVQQQVQQAQNTYVAPVVIDNAVKIAQGAASAAQKIVTEPVRQAQQTYIAPAVQQTSQSFTNYLEGFNRPASVQQTPAVISLPKTHTTDNPRTEYKYRNTIQ